MEKETSKSENLELAPIVLFVFNRAKHTNDTLERLSANTLASQSVIYIYSDGAKKDADSLKIEAVRKICRNYEHKFKSFKLICSNTNKGLAKSIIEGVTEVVKKHGKVIVLEDDLITSKNFLTFMNESLTKYERIDEVMHISGATYPVKTTDLPETYFLRVPLCWGWATWDRAWLNFQKDLDVGDQFTERMKYEFTFNGSHENYWDQLILNKEGKISTWFIYWYATIFMENGLVLFPRDSLIQNIGFDGSGVHCGASDAYSTNASELAPHVSLDNPRSVSKTAYKAHIQYFRENSPSRFVRLTSKLMATLGF
jgi:hypothetical protein